ncbi:MAG: hypothetical protein KJ732_02270, partial [Candidatus Margulisbacteria bacterium]|nr:hypothetical protein [Candidatus Margulisiibacteriota bacterium]
LKLAERIGTWILGIDKDAPAMPPDNFIHPSSSRFFFLQRPYTSINAKWAEFDWLKGSAEKIFMIMPYNKQDVGEEAELIRRIITPGGELHIRTEEVNVFPKIRHFLARPLSEIPFYSAALDITSEATQYVTKERNQGRGIPVYHLGLKFE